MLCRSDFLSFMASAMLGGRNFLVPMCSIAERKRLSKPKMTVSTRVGTFGTRWGRAVCSGEYRPKPASISSSRVETQSSYCWTKARSTSRASRSAWCTFKVTLESMGLFHEGKQVFDMPKAVSDPCGHRRSGLQGLVDAAEVVIGKVERD